MELPRNAFKHKIVAGQRQIGFWLSLGSAAVAEVIAGAGYDWVMIDAEHGPNDLSTVIDQLRVLDPGPATPVVRPAWNDPVLIKRLLDAGAPALLVPFVRNPDEAARAVAATRYPPRGIRGVATSQRASRWGQRTDYVQSYERELLVIVQLETGPSLVALEAIAAVPGVDALFVGPSDLAADMGHLGEPGHPAVQAAISDAVTRCRRVGKPMGIFAPAMEDARRYLDQGVTFAAIGTDAGVLRRGAEALATTFR
jgi:4-hydroxy-2-oxoheptanedioate aldolase